MELSNKEEIDTIKEEIKELTEKLEILEGKNKMSVNDIYEKLRLIKPVLNNDGINILGVFGSYARGDYTSNSDIDILYEIQDIKAFMQKYKGFTAFSKLADTKEFLKKELQKEVDFVDKDTLNEIGKEFILKEVKYV